MINKTKTVCSLSGFNQMRGAKKYEMVNHLGNVLTVISDRKFATCSSEVFTGYIADIVSASDYSPFGTVMQNHSFSSPAYRYGFNGKEKEAELYGEGNTYDFGARIYDSRLGRWMSLDPLQEMYPFASPFSFSLNKPLFFIDNDGRKIIPSNQFIQSRYYKVMIDIVSNIQSMPTANLYFAPFLADKKDVYLRYYNFCYDIGRCSNDQHAKTNNNGVSYKDEVSFNSMAIFKQSVDDDKKSPCTEGDGSRIGGYVSEIFMVTVVMHEFIVHMTDISNDATLGFNSKILNEIKQSILEFAKAKKITLSEQQAAALAYVGAKSIDEGSEFFISNGFKSSSEVITMYSALMTLPNSTSQPVEEYKECSELTYTNEIPMEDKAIINQ